MKTLADSGKLRAARDQAQVCASPNCSKALRDDCSQAVSALTARIPTLVFAVTDGSGNDLAAVRVTMDGQPLVARVDGPAVPVDLGQHTFVFESEGFASATKVLVVREAERDRRVDVRLERGGTAPAHAASSTSDAPAASAPPPASSRPVPPAASLTGRPPPARPSQSSTVEPASTSTPPFRSRWPAYGAFALGGAGIAVGVVYGLLAVDTKKKLDASCPTSDSCPTADQPAIDALGRQATVSTVGFVVGIAGAAAGGVLLWLAHRNEHGSAGSTLVPLIGPDSVGVAGVLP